MLNAVPLSAFVTLSNLCVDMITMCPDIGGLIVLICMSLKEIG